MQPDDHVCLCFHVSRRKIVNFLRIKRPTRATQVSQCGGAGTGCGWCVPFLRKLFEELHEGIEPELPDPEAYADQRKTWIKSGKGNPPDSADS